VTRFILFRLLQAFLTLLILSAVIFFSSHVTGDIVTFLTNPQATQEEIAAMRKSLGLDNPSMSSTAFS